MLVPLLFVFAGPDWFLVTISVSKQLVNINPLSPKSDQHEFSLYNINALENRVVMRLEYMIREDVSN